MGASPVGPAFSVTTLWPNADGMQRWGKDQAQILPPPSFLHIDGEAAGEDQDWLDSWLEEQVARPQSLPALGSFPGRCGSEGMGEYEASHGILKPSTAWIIGVCAGGTRTVNDMSPPRKREEQ